MSSFGFSKLRGGVAPAFFAVVLAIGTGCGGVTAFQGNMAIAATPPPPPPPAPAPAPPPPPPETAKNVEVKNDHIEIHQKIQFEQAKAVIKSESFGLLNEIADVIKKNPQIKKISIEGHSSAEGDAAMNQKLSDERAKSVRTYLVDKGGVKADSLVSKGYGETKPIASNDTDEGKEKNRRVEFVILDPAPKAGGTTAATPAAPAAPASPTTSMKAPKATKVK